jgi:hypothetical protein
MTNCSNYVVVLYLLVDYANIQINALDKFEEENWNLFERKIQDRVLFTMLPIKYTSKAKAMSPIYQ